MATEKYRVHMACWCSCTQCRRVDRSMREWCEDTTTSAQPQSGNRQLRQGGHRRHRGTHRRGSRGARALQPCHKKGKRQSHASPTAHTYTKKAPQHVLVRPTTSALVSHTLTARPHLSRVHQPHSTPTFGARGPHKRGPHKRTEYNIHHKGGSTSSTHARTHLLRLHRFFQLRLRDTTTEGAQHAGHGEGQHDNTRERGGKTQQYTFQHGRGVRGGARTTLCE